MPNHTIAGKQIYWHLAHIRINKTTRDRPAHKSSNRGHGSAGVRPTWPGKIKRKEVTRKAQGSKMELKKGSQRRPGQSPRVDGKG
jgi:hypothetical protein